MMILTKAKTSLLEALLLYANGGSPTLIWDILRIRDENVYRRVERRSTVLPEKSLFANLRYLFHGREDVSPTTEPIEIGPIDERDSRLSISVGWYTRQIGENGIGNFRLLQAEEYDTADNLSLRFTILFGKQRRIVSIRATAPELDDSKLACISIVSSGLDQDLMEEFWGRIALTDLEDDVLTALKIVAPGIERLSFTGESSSISRDLDESSRVRSRERSIPIIRIANIDKPIPLRSLGDGMQRMLGIALSLVNVREGMLLVDEIENGLHYSVLLDMWRLVFQLAHRLNIQVFATTHSWDCIEAFQKAALEDQHEEALLIRLNDKKNGIDVTLFDERRLAIATREQIEVR